ncbi:MAG: FliH/SctL family protein [Thermodesulfovibrio sp.]|nr:FliH/SctL family protein [Thermodesulfovibrio sp.]
MKHLLPENIRPYIPLSFDETLKYSNEAGIEEKAYREGFNFGKQKGYEEGYSRGYEEGIKKGYSEGFKNAEIEIKQKINQLEGIIQILLNLIDELKSFKEKEFRKNFPQILNFALKIAEKVVLSKIFLDRDTILPIIKEILQTLPLQEEKILIKLNPEDYIVVLENLENFGINKNNLSLEPSDSIEKGGYLIETKTQYIESTIQDRLKEIENALNSLFT